MAEYKEELKKAKSNARKSMTAEQISACNGIIHTAAAAAGAAGAIPIPAADAIPITAAQITMVIALGKVFKLNLSKTAAKAILAPLAAAIVGRTIVGGFLKFIPVAGWLISAGVAAGITEAIGWTIANDFAVQYKNNKLEDNILDDYFAMRDDNDGDIT